MSANQNKEVYAVDDAVDDASKGRSEHLESGVDLAYEKKMMRKIDIRLLPILGILYSVSLIDRTNMSNAAVAGMRDELKLKIGDRYSIALLIFFIPYLLFELPSNIVLRRVGAAKWLGTIVMLWGGVMIGMGFVKDWRVLVVCRAILGLFEAGFFPACVYLISSWYVRYEVQKRLAAFYLISSMIGGFSSILAYGLMQMDGLGGLGGWRWIFIIEGIITCVCAACAYVFIIDFPDKLLEHRKPFLTSRDVELVKARIDRDRDDSEADPLTWAKVGLHLSDWKLWLYSILFMNATVAAYAFPFFMPIILQIGMGYTAGMAQILSAPPYISAVAIALVLAWLSDKTRLRAPFIIIGNILVVVGLSMTAYHKSNGVRYLGIFIGMAGAQSNIPAVLTYQANNIRTNSKRSVGSALQIGFGGIGGIYASTVFREKDLPRYLNGLWATMACQLSTILFLAIFTLYFKRKNRQHREGTLTKPLEGHADFMYTI
ncbi:major facilitator superfamily domain-containing protein [Morchella snyderi]|nr:major facilitator superfamily domain-containing protein [Morchella snyderi]